jgi:hypothetical protein
LQAHADVVVAGSTSTVAVGARLACGVNWSACMMSSWDQASGLVQHQLAATPLVFVCFVSFVVK